MDVLPMGTMARSGLAAARLSALARGREAAMATMDVPIATMIVTNGMVMVVAMLMGVADIAGTTTTVGAEMVSGSTAAKIFMAAAMTAVVIKVSMVGAEIRPGVWSIEVRPPQG